ncbi:MAG: hypothetical protein ACOY94_06435 [Bacillota bacterium]
MTDEPKQRTAEEERRLQEEQEEREFNERVRELNNRVHRHMGMTAAVLGIIAAIVGFWLLSSRLGISPWTALKEAGPLFLIVLVILGLGVVFSLGTSRLAYGIELLVKRYKKK